MEAIRKIQQKLHGSSSTRHDELDMSLQSPLVEKMEPCYEDSRSSDETQTPQRHGHQSLYQTRHEHPSNKFLKFTTVILTFALVTLSFFHALLLLNPRSVSKPCEPVPATTLQTKDCGSSVKEAKAKGCWWDELTKAWLPAECPDYGIEEYKAQGMIFNPLDNAISWPYYIDQEGTRDVNLIVVSSDEERDPNEVVWTTSRQHLTHCAYSLKRVVWAYQNGKGQYGKAAALHHVNHCIDTLFRRAVRLDDGVDLITTTVRVNFGWCDFYGPANETEG
ncbi:hypothetical protein OQA88_5390 [Cercophora sp. LCS_1]